MKQSTIEITAMPVPDEALMRYIRQNNHTGLPDSLIYDYPHLKEAEPIYKAFFKYCLKKAFPNNGKIMVIAYYNSEMGTKLFRVPMFHVKYSR